jgi:hypothetical protein
MGARGYKDWTMVTHDKTPMAFTSIFKEQRKI